MTGRKQILADFLCEVWSEGLLARIPHYLADTYTIEHDPGDPWEGQALDVDGFVDRVRRSRAPFPDQRFDVVAMLADGDGVAVSWRWTATHRGDIPGFAATLRPVTMSGITVYSFDSDDRLTGHWQVVDRLGVFQQLQQNAAAGPVA